MNHVTRSLEMMACLYWMRPFRMEDIMNIGGGDAPVLDERGAQKTEIIIKSVH